MRGGLCVLTPFAKGLPYKTRWNWFIVAEPPHIRLVFSVKNQALLARVQHFTNLSTSCNARTICFNTIHVQVLVHIYYYYYCSMQYNMYHKRPWTRKMPSRSPCPKAAEARGRRPGAGRRRAWGSRGHFGGRCCLTAGATTDHSPDASRLRHPVTGTSNKVQ